MTTQLRVSAPEGLIDELARVLWDPEQAKTLVLRAGFPPSDLPAFEIATAFWSRVIREAADGKIPGGAQPIIEEVASRFPGNTFLATYRAKGAWVSRRSDSVGPPQPNTLDSPPRAACLQPERLMAAGRSTEDVDVGVLELRREQRRRPTAPSSRKHGMPSWSVFLPGVFLAGLVTSGVTAASAWWKPNVDVPSTDIASMGAVANVDMTDPVEANERVEHIGTTNALVATNGPVEIRSEEEQTKSDEEDDAVPDYASSDAYVDADAPSRDCGLDSKKCNRSKKISSRSSKDSRPEAARASSEPSFIDLPEVDDVPSEEAFSKTLEPADAACPVEPTKCNTPKATGGTSGARAPSGSTNPGAPEKLSKADLKPGIDAVKDAARACGPRHGAKHDEKVTVDLVFAGASGTVLSSIPRKPHADTPLGSCVAEALADIKVIEFKRHKQGIAYWIEL